MIAMSSTHAGARGDGLRRRSGSARTALLLIGAVLLGACGGDNLFSGPNAKLAQVPPVVTAIDAPAVVDEGASLEVKVRVFSTVGATRVDLKYRGAITEDKSFPVESRTDTASITAVINLPAEVQDSVLVIEATVTDRLDRTSDPVTRSVRVNDKSAPVVNATVSPNRVSIGDTIRIRVNARDNAGLQSVGYALMTAAGDTVGAVTLASARGATLDTTFVVVLPQSLRPADLRVIGIAVNTAQIRGFSAAMPLAVVDLLPPTVTILAPRPGDSYPLTDSILVRVHVADSSGVAEVRLRGVAIRRDSLQNTAVVVRYLEKVVPLPGPVGTAPRDTTLVRYLLPAPIDVSEPVYIVAEAKDLAGNVRADTVRIIDGPRIQIMNPADGGAVSMNRVMLVHLTAVDRVSGLDSVKLRISGVRSDVVDVKGLGGREALDTTVAVNTGAVAGTMTLEALAWNRLGSRGSGPVVRLTVGTVETVDSVAPSVSRRVTAPARVELDDSIHVAVRSTDGSGSGIRRAGAVITLVPDSDQLSPRTIYRSTDSFEPPLGGSPEHTFGFTLGDVYSELEMTFPRRFTVQVHAFAVDAANNCGASVSDQLTRATCVPAAEGTFTASGLTPALLQVTATQGRSVRLPDGGRIADAVADAQRRRIYLSNIDNNRVEIFHLDADTFATTGTQTRRGLVGAAPWGMAMSVSRDSLYVANSGGTNISVLPLNGQGYMIEDHARRIQTPNMVLFDLTMSNSNGFLRYTLNAHDFSDRPQFIAQHSSRALVYSTRPTPAARDGTLRWVDPEPGTLGESYLLHGGTFTPTENAFAIANVDSVRIIRSVDDNDYVVLYDRHPRTGAQLVSEPLPFHEALEQLVAAGSDIEGYAGTWNRPSIGLADTTYVAVSSDHGTIAFGEGGRSPFGRVFLCCSVTENDGELKLGLSVEIGVHDLVNNAAERVFGVGLNQDGTLGVARGGSSTYFFNPRLRLQGEFRSGMAGGAGGAALHPRNSAYGTGSQDHGLAFAATAQRTIKIIDTWHFYERGEIPIRDRVVGPLRVIEPAPSENQGRGESDPNYIVVKLVAVTEGGNVVVIDVRRKDLNR